MIERSVLFKALSQVVGPETAPNRAALMAVLSGRACLKSGAEAG